MDEAGWIDCRKPLPMLSFLEGRASSRKLRLFACACCRRIFHHLSHPHSRKAVEFAETHVDVGLRRLRHRRKIWTAAHLALEKAIAFARASNNPDEYTERKIGESAAHAAQRLVEEDAWAAAVSVSDAAASALGHAHFGVDLNAPATGLDHFIDARDLEYARQCGLLRDIIGTPFRPVAVEAGWLTSTVTKLASAAYEDRIVPEGSLDPDRLAVLADALEDAGCTDPVILDHCRSSAAHVRGCWLVDAILGKA